MSASRLNASVEASALIRQVQGDGGFAAVLRRGDPERGALLLVIGSRGEHHCCLQRQLQLSSGIYEWIRVGPERSSGSADLSQFLASQARFDPDCWQIELDIPEAERFIAETTASG